MGFPFGFWSLISEKNLETDLEERWKAISLAFEVKKKRAGKLQISAPAGRRVLETRNRESPAFAVRIQRSHHVQQWISAKSCLVEGASVKEWWALSSSGKPVPGFAQFPKIREKMKSYLLFVFRLKNGQLSVEAMGKAQKARAMREGLLGRTVVHHFVRGQN